MANVFMNTYHRLPVVFAKGEGAWLTDIQGKKYLDFTSGIAVNCLGHAHPAIVKAVSDQAARLNHVCNYFQSDISEAFAEKLIEVSGGAGMKKLFLANSGAEANEGACKIARKYSLSKYGKGRHKIVTLKGSFHGRTITTLAATGQEHFHKDFGPYTEGFAYVQGGDKKALDAALDKNTAAAFLVEPIQGESGVIPQTSEYLSFAAKICAERDILLIFDEIQTGVGRTGAFFACEGYGIKPDVITLAKGLAGGIPAGAVLAGEKAADVFQIGDHGSTFGGNAVAAAAGLAVLDIVARPEFLAEIARKGEKIKEIILSWNHPQIAAVRGRGLMLGIDIGMDAWPLLEAAIARASENEPGLLLLTAGKQTLRLHPPYIISDSELEEGLNILRGILQLK